MIEKKNFQKLPDPYEYLVGVTNNKIKKIDLFSEKMKKFQKILKSKKNSISQKKKSIFIESLKINKIKIKNQSILSTNRKNTKNRFLRNSLNFQKNQTQKKKNTKFRAFILPKYKNKKKQINLFCTPNTTFFKKIKNE